MSINPRYAGVASVLEQPEFAREPLALLVRQVGVDQVGEKRALVRVGFRKIDAGASVARTVLVAEGFRDLDPVSWPVLPAS